MAEEQWHDVKYIVNLLQVHEQTVRRWIKTGELPAILFGRKGGYRVKASDLQAFLDRQAEKGKAAA